MSLLTKQWNCLSRRSKRVSSEYSFESGDRGYAFLLLMMTVTILLVSLTAALPSIYTEGQREREKDLIFRGTQYARAIYYFHRQFHRYPTSVKELIRTNGIRFLRHAYRDPMTRSGKWRFIHANASGVILDSLTLGPPKKKGQGKQNNQGNAGFGGMNQSLFPHASSLLGGGGKIQGAYIVGVASTSHRQSIRVWNHHDHYNEWEFLGVDTNMLGFGQGLPGQTGSTGQPATPGKPGLPEGQSGTQGTPKTPTSGQGIFQQ